MTIQIHYADTLKGEQYNPRTSITRTSRGISNIAWSISPVGQTDSTPESQKTVLCITGQRQGPGSGPIAAESSITFPFSADLLSTTTNDRIMIGFKMYGSKPILSGGWGASYHPIDFGPFVLSPASNSASTLNFMGQQFPSPFSTTGNNGVPVLMILDVDTTNRTRGSFTLIIDGEVKVIVTASISAAVPMNRIRGYTVSGSGSLTNLFASLPIYIGDIFYATGGQRGEAIMNWDFQNLTLQDATPLPDEADWTKTGSTFAESIKGPGLSSPNTFATAVSDNVPLKFTTSVAPTYPNLGAILGYVDGTGLGASQAAANTQISIKVNDKSFAQTFPLWVNASASITRMLNKQQLGWEDDVNISSVEITKTTR